MSSFLIAENIRRFKALLAGELDADRRRVVERLLVEEEAKGSAVMGADPAPPHRQGDRSASG